MKLNLAIDFETALHHGSGFGLAGVVDRAVLRDAKGLPYLAGSALKGKFRYVALRILRSRGEGCGPPGREICKAAPWCALCRVFGSPMKAGAAIFEDAQPCDRDLLLTAMEGARQAFDSAACQVRTTTAIDRHRKTVLPQHLFSTETVANFVRFEGTIRGALTRDERKLLEQCARLLTHFGSDSSRGLGFCRCHLTEVEE